MLETSFICLAQPSLAKGNNVDLLTPRPFGPVLMHFEAYAFIQIITNALGSFHHVSLSLPLSFSLSRENGYFVRPRAV